MVKTDRLETLVQREISDILQNEVHDTLGFITVTAVKITNELSFMYVYYTVLGNPDQLAHTQAALERAKGFIKNQVAARVKMRKMPELVFKVDEAFSKGLKVDSLLKKIK
jgi:ribosome-binding factor A